MTYLCPKLITKVYRRGQYPYLSLTLSICNENFPSLLVAPKNIPMISEPSVPKLINGNVKCFHSGSTAKDMIEGLNPRLRAKIMI